MRVECFKWHYVLQINIAILRKKEILNFGNKTRKTIKISKSHRKDDFLINMLLTKKMALRHLTIN